MKRLGFVGFLTLLAACGSTDDGANGDGTNPDGTPYGEGDGGQNPNGPNGGDGGDEPFTPVYGRFGTPETTFTLPVSFPGSGGAELYVPDVVAKYPDVDWSKLDRLYIPAGIYKGIKLGGLPTRTAERPLVITNLGGQVKIGGFKSGYTLSLGGGANWILTGRFDPDSKTGDAAFRGHAEGSFAKSQGTYGIFVDDAFSQTGLSGLTVGEKATDFELEVIEIARAEFAGVVAKTDNDGSATMKNVRFHDMYVHDTGSEGIYFGSTQAQPQHAFEGLKVYDNRLLRTGTEALQVGQLGDGCEVHHNVLGPGAVRWRSAFADYQDGNVQYGQRYGSSSFHHNVVLGTGDLFVEFFPTLVDGDPRKPGTDTVTFADNYFSDTSSGGIYTHAVNTGVAFHFERNALRGFNFNYDSVYPSAKAPSQVFGVGSGSTSPHVLSDNVVDGPYPFFQGTVNVVTATNNTQGTVDRVKFRDFMGDAIDQNYRLLEWWTDQTTRTPGSPATVYEKGRLVIHQGTIYEALEQNSEMAPDQNPTVWKALAAPVDDVRLANGSPHAGLGLRWPPPK